MPKRKKLTPRKLNNSEEHLTSVSFNDDCESKNDDCCTVPKSLKLNIDKYFNTILRKTSKNELYYIDKMLIGTSKNIFPENWMKCKLNLSQNGTLKMNFDSVVDAVIQLQDNDIFVKEILKSKIFSYGFEVNTDTEEVTALLYLQLPLTKHNKKTGCLIKKTMQRFYNIQTVELCDRRIIENDHIENFYRNINKHGKDKFMKNYNEIENTLIQHPSLLPKLRTYQIDAVRWMIQKETTSAKKEILHPMFIPVQLKSTTVYFNIYDGFVQTARPTVIQQQSGGILADEMGLGKTVEVLACILHNPRIPDEKTKTPNGIETANSFLNENFDVDNVILHNMKNIQNTSYDKIDNLCNLDVPIICLENINNANRSENICQENETKINNVPNIESQLKCKIIKTAKSTKHTVKKKDKHNSLFTAKKSATRLAAQIWYENKLAEMVIKDKKKKVKVDVKCICGNFDMTNIIHCKECSGLQHINCVGYKGKQEDYICSQCWLSQPKIKSKATLIVSPMSICRQWSQEIKRHIRKNGLNVLLYKGIHKAGLMYPTNLAKYDLVITTYSVLQSELKFTCDEQCSISFRNAKRYNVPTTPLLNIEWWRLCLDEAQMVDCPSSQVSLMANQLIAVHRWAVTGTPMQKSISDLHGLLQYLKLTPYDDIDTFNNILYYPYVRGNIEPFMNFLKQVMWRSNKLEVIEQINIPLQTIKEHWQEFSAVEKYFYKREHSLCAKEFLTKIKQFATLDVTLKSINRHTLNNVLAPLLSLRQACTHPHAMRGKYLSCRHVNSMKDLLEALIKKNVKECEESLRAVLAALNGTAGVLLLKANTLEAVNKYCEALQLISQYEQHEFIKIDKLQRIHTLYNLNQILKDTSDVELPSTVEEKNLADECEKVQQQYMEKYTLETKSAYLDVEKTTNSIIELKKKMTLDENEWICELLNWFMIQSYDDELMKKIHTLDNEHGKFKFEEVLSVRSIMYLLTTWTDKIKKNSEKLHKLFSEFKIQFDANETNYMLNEHLVNAAMMCHLRPTKKDKNKNERKMCLSCSLDISLKKYECVIFQMKGKNDKIMESNEGTWHPSLEEKLLKVIQTFGKSKGADEELMKNGKIHLNVCFALRKQFKELRRLYTFYDQQISAQDEVNICKIRFRLQNPDDPVKIIAKRKHILQNLNYEIDNKHEFINILNEIDLDYKFCELCNEHTIANQLFKKMLGTHSYLETLKRQQYSGQDPDPCPICRCDLKDSWSILSCGHCFCLDCISKLVERFKLVQHIICSICRKRQPIDEISYIKVNQQRDNIGENDIDGSYSTKIQEILRATLILKRGDPSVKILIFSTWAAVLKVLSAAFSKINISHEHLTTNKLEEKLINFKDTNKGITVLLIPVKLGAKGLNLVEATHVFLVEPLMNPSEELQAVGRVHRIGQTKPTFVHRFLIKSTIEENIHNSISANVDQWDGNKLTLHQLKDLFVSNESIQDDLKTIYDT